MPRKVLVEQTSKSLKAVMLLSFLVMIGGIVWGVYWQTEAGRMQELGVKYDNLDYIKTLSTAGAGWLAAIAGFAVLTIAKLVAWWEHG